MSESRESKEAVNVGREEPALSEAELSGAEGLEVFLDRLRYFNEMLAEMQGLLRVEDAELLPLRRAERSLEGLVEQRKRTVRELAAAEAAAVTARESLERLRGRAGQTMQDAEGLLESLMEDLRQRPDVRSQYVMNLQTLRSSLSDIAELSTDPSKGADGRSPLPGAPQSLQAYAGEDGTVTLDWEGEAEGVFEVEAAVGSLQSYRGSVSAVASQQFLPLGEVTGTGFTHAVIDAVGRPIAEGVPVQYRVRARRGTAVSPWSEPVTVIYTRRGAAEAAGTKRRGFRTSVAGVLGAITGMDKGSAPHQA